MSHRLHLCALCRGPSHAFVGLWARGLEGELAFRARSARSARPMPVVAVELAKEDARLLLRADPAGRRAWVVALPLLSSVVVEVVDGTGDVCATTTVPAPASRLASRLFSLTRPAIASLMRATMTRQASGVTQVRLVWASPASVAPAAPNVWRFSVSYPVSDGTGSAQLAVYDAGATLVPASSMVLEDHVVPAGQGSALQERLVTMSVALPERLREFYVVASLAGTRGTPPAGFAVVFDAHGAHLLGEARHAQTGVIGDGAYGAWFANRRASRSDLAAQRAACASTGARPLVSIVMPVFRPEPSHLAEAMASVRAQSWGAWELVVVAAGDGAPDDPTDRVLASYGDDPRVRVLRCENRSIAENTNVGISAATGDYVAFMDHDDLIEPDALWHYVRAICEDPEADLLYCDEDRLDEGGFLRSPAFKAGPSLGKLYAYNYVTHMLVVSRRVLDLTERSEADVSGAQDLDLTLKAFEVARSVRHVPRVLYHWRDHPGSTAGGLDAKPYAHEAGRLAIKRHLARRSLAADVADGPLPYTYRVRFGLPDRAPRVSVIIPSRDQAALLRACVTSLLGMTDYPDYEVVIVENGSTRTETFALYDELCSDARVRVVAWELPPSGTFSYSAVCNFGAAVADGDALLFLNNDTEVLEARWMREMVGQLVRPEVGVVGARLVFPDGLLQHAGIVATPDGTFMHASGGIASDALGYGYGVALPADVEMVTGACQLVRRSVFDEVGGYDERLAVGFNDGDLCLRARSAGHVVAYCPYATLLHREFASRGREATDVRLQERYLRERARFVLAHAGELSSGTACHNPNLDRESPLPRLQA